MKSSFVLLSSIVVLGARVETCCAYDYEGHRLVNQLALGALPPDFPAFVKTEPNRERIAFLAGEPDRWRNSSEPSFQHINAPDHFIDLEDLAPYGLEPASLTAFRYEFVAQMAKAVAAKPERFPTVDPSKDPPRTRGLPGFLPWTINEYYAKLRSGFSSLRAFEEGGTPEEIANAQQDVVYVMGLLGHFVGDASQPLHTTRHFNGWVGNNLGGYTTNRTFHAWIDGGYLTKVGMPNASALQPKLHPARLLWTASSESGNAPAFARAMEFILEQHRLVEPLYLLEKEGKLAGDTELGRQGLVFMEGQLVKGAQLLSDLWYSAWREAPPDRFLQSQLAKRKLSHP